MAWRLPDTFVIALTRKQYSIFTECARPLRDTFLIEDITVSIENAAWHVPDTFCIALIRKHRLHTECVQPFI